MSVRAAGRRQAIPTAAAYYPYGMAEPGMMKRERL
jgi:hypothetical protein